MSRFVIAIVLLVVPVGAVAQGESVADLRATVDLTRCALDLSPTVQTCVDLCARFSRRAGGSGNYSSEEVSTLAYAVAQRAWGDLAQPQPGLRPSVRVSLLRALLVANEENQVVADASRRRSARMDPTYQSALTRSRTGHLDTDLVFGPPTSSGTLAAALTHAVSDLGDAESSAHFEDDDLQALSSTGTTPLSEISRLKSEVDSLLELDSLASDGASSTRQYIRAVRAGLELLSDRMCREGVQACVHTWSAKLLRSHQSGTVTEQAERVLIAARPVSWGDERFGVPTTSSIGLLAYAMFRSRQGVSCTVPGLCTDPPIPGRDPTSESRGQQQAAVWSVHMLWALRQEAIHAIGEEQEQSALWRYQRALDAIAAHEERTVEVPRRGLGTATWSHYCETNRRSWTCTPTSWGSLPVLVGGQERSTFRVGRAPLGVKNGLQPKMLRRPFERLIGLRINLWSRNWSHEAPPSNAWLLVAAFWRSSTSTNPPNNSRRRFVKRAQPLNPESPELKHCSVHI